MKVVAGVGKTPEKETKEESRKCSTAELLREEYDFGVKEDRWLAGNSRAKITLRATVSEEIADTLRTSKQAT